MQIYITVTTFFTRHPYLSLLRCSPHSHNHALYIFSLPVICCAVLLLSLFYCPSKTLWDPLSQGYRCSCYDHYYYYYWQNTRFDQFFHKNRSAEAIFDDVGVMIIYTPRKDSISHFRWCWGCSSWIQNTYTAASIRDVILASLSSHLQTVQMTNC